MSYLFIANWKMRMHFTETLNYCHENKQQLINLCNKNSLVLCPSFIALAPVAQLFHSTPVKIGAQNCSAFQKGSYTGQISAQSLQEVGCSYCIVGHSEQRTVCNETNEAVAEKVVRLLEQNITPIICIGENKLDALNTRTQIVLQEQLNPILTSILAHHIQKQHLIFAYEPIWAIGTGVLPDQEYLINIFDWLHTTISAALPNHSFQLLYGGSVDEHNIAQLARVKHINGFLIGSASTQFLHLKKILNNILE
jgi:triosephosphate isomerase (TIM)